MPVNWMFDLEHLHKLFDVVMCAVSSSGGDGWGCVVSRHPDRLADEFEKYAAEKGWGLDRKDNDDMTHWFFCGQEGITFTDQHPEHWGGDEILVNIPFLTGTD